MRCVFNIRRQLYKPRENERNLVDDVQDSAPLPPTTLSMGPKRLVFGPCARAGQNQEDGVKGAAVRPPAVATSHPSAMEPLPLGTMVGME